MSLVLCQLVIQHTIKILLHLILSCLQSIEFQKYKHMKESWLRKSENGGNSSSLARVLAKVFCDPGQTLYYLNFSG